MNFRKAFQVSVLLAVAQESPLTFGQTIYKQTGESYLSISGTSTLHEWTMTSQEGKVQANITVNADGTPIKIHSLSLSLASESLKSGHAAMDKNAYSSLGTDVNKTIRFELLSAKTTN